MSILHDLFARRWVEELCRECGSNPFDGRLDLRRQRGMVRYTRDGRAGANKTVCAQIRNECVESVNCLIGKCRAQLSELEAALFRMFFVRFVDQFASATHKLMPVAGSGGDFATQNNCTSTL